MRPPHHSWSDAPRYGGYACRVRRLLGKLVVAAALTTSFAVRADIDVVRARIALRGTLQHAPPVGVQPPASSSTAMSLRAARHERLFAHASGSVPILIPLPSGVRAEDRGLLAVAPGFGAIHLQPSGVDAFVTDNPDLRMLTAPPRHTMLDTSFKVVNNRAYTNTTGNAAEGIVVGIIDTGLDVTHPDFLDDEGNTRVAWLIQRGAPRGVHTSLEGKFGCTQQNQSPCAIFDAADINALIQNDPDNAPRDRDGHGTHVASIAAGDGGNANQRYAGMARRATLVIASPSPEGGGFSDPDILKAARFIFDRAEAMGMPAVVNVSLGSDFGPHDGTSGLERGLAAMVGPNFPGRVIVVAAGNSGELYRVGDAGPFGIHTEAHSSANATTRVVLQTPGGEGEVDGGGFVWVTFRPGDEVSVGLEGPDGASWVGLTEPGEESGFDDDDITAGVVNNLVNDKTALTEDTNGAVVFFEGKWPADGDIAILLRGSGDAQLWVAPSGGATTGAAGLGLSFARSLRNGTITVPASHPSLIAVGCTLNRTSWRPAYSDRVEINIQTFGGLDPAVVDSTCYFSAAGPLPDGTMKPDILAPGGLVAGAMSRDANPSLNPNSIFNSPSCPDQQPCFVVDETHALTSGTSMSSPHVAGAAALLLEVSPNLTQGEMLEVLQAGAQRPTGVVPFDFQAGPGQLDVLGSIAVLDGMAGSAPDIENSYYVLSSPYARPDPSWAVRGVVELRDAANEVVFGVAATRVALRLNGATVVDSVVRVRGGLYRFSFAAPVGSGGTTATIEVFVDGQSLGKRVLPVGVDAWAAGSGVKPVGGCACTVPPGSAADDWPGLGLLGLGILAWRRREQSLEARHDGRP